MGSDDVKQLYGLMRGSVVISPDVDLTEPFLGIAEDAVRDPTSRKPASGIDYFAELYVAGRFGDAGWNVYFPHRDRGFDFIVSKPDSRGMQILRPVQVKGKYPTAVKTEKAVYGYVGGLSQIHPELVLAIPFFGTGTNDMPVHTAYLPMSVVRPNSRGYRCNPASFKLGRPVPRPGYQKFFDAEGLRLLESSDWKDSVVQAQAKTMLGA